MVSEIERLRRDCAEAYQVLGSISTKPCTHTDRDVERALDNLCAAAEGKPRPHEDLLPWPEVHLARVRAVTPMDEEDTVEPSAHEPRVTDAPEAVWLVYGDLERDATHRECCESGEVTWCEDAQFAADVRYLRADLLHHQARQIAGEALEPLRRLWPLFERATNGCVWPNARANLSATRAQQE